jgi:hypothetical protein
MSAKPVFDLKHASVIYGARSASFATSVANNRTAISCQFCFAAVAEAVPLFIIKNVFKYRIMQLVPGWWEPTQE